MAKNKEKKIMIGILSLILGIFFLFLFIKNIPLIGVLSLVVFIAVIHHFVGKWVIVFVIIMVLVLFANGMFNVVLAKFGYAIFTNEGYSNYACGQDFYMPPSNITFVKLTDDVSIGDMVYYRYGHMYIVHRIIGRDEQGWIVKGLNNEQIDPPVSDNQVVGRVVTFLKVPCYTTKTWMITVTLFLALMFSVFHDWSEEWRRKKK